MKRTAIFILFLTAVIGIASIGYGQKQKKEVKLKKEEIKEEFFPTPQGDEDMRVIESRKNMISSGVQYGAWITPTFITSVSPQLKSILPPTFTVPVFIPSNKFVTDTLTTSVSTARVWLKTYLWDNSFLYVRGKDTYTGSIWQDGINKIKEKNVADLDLGYIAMATPDGAIDVSVGRKYFLVGSGLIFNGRGDGLEFNYYSQYINIKLLGAWTGWLAKDDNPYGLSDRDISTGAKRVFAGGLLSTEWLNQTLYAYGLAQFDFGREYYDRTKKDISALGGNTTGFIYYGLKSHYESQYYAAGLQGVIFSESPHTLSYAGEAIMERGRSHLFGFPKVTDVLAYAGQFNLTYYVNVMLKPMFTAEYFFGSGDVNRPDYHFPNTNTKGKDRGFLYFGTFVGGYALKPLLANMHVFSGGFSFSPFTWSSVPFVNNMSIVLKYYYYMKHKASSPINYGLDATKPVRDIGHEADASLRWAIFSDLAFFANFGLFLPGKAFGNYYEVLFSRFRYSSTQDRYFVMGGFNISF